MLAVAICLAACGAPPPPVLERPPAPVTVQAAVAEDVPLYLDEIGRVVAREVVSIRPQVSGQITAIHFADGAELAAGDPLFTIELRPYQAELAAAEARLAESLALVELARVEFERVAKLVETDTASRSNYDTRKNALDVAAAKAHGAEAARDAARLDLEHCSIVSPIEGRAGERLVDLGNVVKENEGTLVVIQRLDPIYAEFTVPETELGAVQREMARGTLAVEVRLPEEPGSPRTGALTFLDNAVGGGTGTVKLRATLDNKDRFFWPGRFVQVRLVLDTLRAAVLVPAAAPQRSAEGSFVFVARPDSTAELRPVQLGQRQGERVVVSRGLEPGERVVVVGQLALVPGGKLRVVEPPKTPAAGGGP